MRRSDGLFAIGLGTCLDTSGFAPGSRIRAGDKVLLYYRGPVNIIEDLIDRDVQGPQHGTWGLVGENYRVDYLFPVQHQYSREIVQEVIQHEW